MGFFDLKATCINCEKEIGLNRFKTAEGWICPDCFKLCGYNMMTPIKTKTISDIRADITKKDLQKEELTKFTATKKLALSLNLTKLINDGLFQMVSWEGRKIHVFITLMMLLNMNYLKMEIP